LEIFRLLRFFLTQLFTFLLFGHFAGFRVDGGVLLEILVGSPAFLLFSIRSCSSTITEAGQNSDLSLSGCLAQPEAATAQFRRRKGKFVVSILGWCKAYVVIHFTSRQPTTRLLQMALIVLPDSGLSFSQQQPKQQ
jgi:hypothetical protein